MSLVAERLLLYCGESTWYTSSNSVSLQPLTSKQRAAGGARGAPGFKGQPLEWVQTSVKSESKPTVQL